MKRFATMLMMGALIGATSLVTSASAEDACGDDGQKPCPMQGWMEDNLQKPLDAGDLKKVAAALEKAAAMAPDKKWNEGPDSWEALAKKGAAAAKAGDEKATKASCKSCHKAHRKEYKNKFRTRPVK